MAPNNTSENEITYHKLNQETGKINWTELQKYFASGVVVVIEKDLDLVKVAEIITADQDIAIKSFIDSGKIHRATDNDAETWNKINQEFWAIVIAPWVLVQETNN